LEIGVFEGVGQFRRNFYVDGDLTTFVAGFFYTKKNFVADFHSL